jgi:hypothetical protein
MLLDPRTIGPREIQKNIKCAISLETSIIILWKETFSWFNAVSAKRVDYIGAKRAFFSVCIPNLE